MDKFAERLHRIDPDIAQRLVDAGLKYPVQIRGASDAKLKEALKGRGVTAAVDAVRKAYPPRK